jgi:hypothetical protein
MTTSINQILDTGVLCGDEDIETLKEVLERSDLQIRWLLESTWGEEKRAALDRLTSLSAKIESILYADQLPAYGLDGMTPIKP